MDNLTSEQRRKNMQHIRSKDTKIEGLLRKALWKKGYRFRKNYKELPGKPDIVFTKYKIAIFCDGEFFHGKDWEVLKPRLEKSNNSEYWIMVEKFGKFCVIVNGRELERHINYYCEENECDYIFDKVEYCE